MTIRGEDSPRPSVTANDSFAGSVMGCRNLAGGALAPYFIGNKNADVADDFDIPGTIIDTTTGKPQEAQWIRGTSKGSFDGFHFATWVKDHLVPCIPNVSPENPAIVICDGHYAHVVDEVLDTCAALGILMVLLPPHCTHLLQGEDLYHFGVFKVRFASRAQKPRRPFSSPRGGLSRCTRTRALLFLSVSESFGTPSALRGRAPGRKRLSIKGYGCKV